MSKVLVDRELLEVYLGERDGDWVEAGHELRAILAQPSEAEGVDGNPHGPDTFKVARHSKRLVEQLRAELSAERTRADVAVADANDAERALAAVTAERDRLKHAPAQDLLERLVAQLIESGAENYQESVFDLEVGSDVLTASVVLRHLDKPGPHELRMQAEAERDQLRAEVEAMRPGAERYRWLRDEAQWLEGVPQVIQWRCNGEPQEIISDDELDEAIDAALAAKEAL